MVFDIADDAANATSRDDWKAAVRAASAMLAPVVFLITTEMLACASRELCDAFCDLCGAVGEASAKEVVRDVEEGSAAQASGVRPGDIILAVGSEASLSVRQVAAALRHSEHATPSSDGGVDRMFPVVVAACTRSTAAPASHEARRGQLRP